MTTTDVTTASSTRASGYRLPVLQLVFVVSGFCGLIYESIWSRYLKLFVGHAAYAQTVVLVVFIGGMALGAWLVGRMAHRIRTPLVAYAAVEAVIGVISLFFHQGFVALTEWGYATLLPIACSPESPCLAQWVLASAMILPQSVLLGTTFPLMTAGILRLAPTNPGSRIALFYFLNSIGAVFGVLASAFVLVPAVGLPGALLSAGLLNFGVAIAAYACSKGAPTAVLQHAVAGTSDTDTPSLRRLLLLVAAVTGLSSFVYEIVWIRMLSLVIGASTDAFELMLAAFILGLALGGLWVRKRIDRFRDLLTALAVVQVLMGAAAVATLPLYDRTFDFLAWLMTSLGRTDGGYLLYNLASQAIALAVMLPATFLAGMTLPLLTTALLRGRQGEQAIGFVYASNTLGAILGVFVAVHLAMPALGVKGALVLGAAIDVGLAVILFHWNRDRTSRVAGWGWSMAGVLTVLAVGALVPVSVERTASGVYRHGLARIQGEFKVLHHRDGKTATIDVLQSPNAISIRTNGKSDASIAVDSTNPVVDEFTMAFTSVLPLAYRPSIKRAAVIGFGSGMTTATLLGSPNLVRLDTIEIEPQMVEGARHFGATVERAYTDPRSHIIIDDAKSYFARSQTRYDLIVSEPSNPWVSGVASLFTTEFYRRVKHQLSEDGVFVQWIQAYEFSNPLLATILRAIDAEFADYAVYASNSGDMILIASNGKLPARPSAEFTQFAGLKPTLARLQMDSVDEVERRRLAGSTIVRALLPGLGAGVNSDYYPVVDLGAPRDRFLRNQANALMTIAVAPVPIVEMLEPRSALPISWTAPPAPDSGDRRVATKTAVAIADWLVTGKRPEESAPPLPHDIGLFRAIVWDCAQTPPRIYLSAKFIEVAEFVNPHLPAAYAGQVWKAVRAARCASQFSATDRKWLDLVAAVGARDAGEMARLGTELAVGTDDAHTQQRTYALMAGATGLIALGRKQEARDLLSAQLGRLPVAVRSQPAFLLLQGHAGAPDYSAAVSNKPG